MGLERRGRKWWGAGSLVFLGWALSWTAFAADDPSIQGALRQGIRSSMEKFLEARTRDGVLLLYDPIDDKLLRLTSQKLHDGIVKKSEFYVSCADFTDQDGRQLDVDLFVLPVGDGLQTTQAIVHKVNGEKRNYRLETH